MTGITYPPGTLKSLRIIRHFAPELDHAYGHDDIDEAFERSSHYNYEKVFPGKKYEKAYKKGKNHQPEYRNPGCCIIGMKLAESSRQDIVAGHGIGKT